MTRLMKIVLGLVLVSSLPVGCSVIEEIFGGGGGETGSSNLKKFESEAELLAYMRGEITARNDSLAGFDRDFDDAAPDEPLAEADGSGAGGEAAAPPSPGDSSLTADGSYSQTTTQEQGVEEADVVKTDGRNLYIISGRNSDSVLRIVSIGSGGATQLLSETSLTGYGRDLYLHEGKVVALTSGGGFIYPILFAEGGVAQTEPADGVGVDDDVEPIKEEVVEGDEPIGTDIIGILPIEDFVYERPNTRTTVIDVSNPSAPRVLSSTKIDGTPASSRMVGGVLHLVMANYQDYYYDVMPRLGTPDVDVTTVDTAELLPKYTRTNADGSEESGNVLTWEDLYRPTDPDGFGVVSVVNLDIDADARFTAVGVVAEPGLVYSSIEALYMTDTNYAWDGDSARDRTDTDIYKFKYEGRGAVPVATGTVSGRILNQYAMSEHNNHLRVATTNDATFVFDDFGFGGQATPATNNVYVLRQDGGSLNIVGRVENIAPDETIQSARFLGDKGFVVTFRQVDPLFTFDLSVPEAPKVMGELTLPGFSTFLTPIDEQANFLLAVGQHVPLPGEAGNWGVKVSIFDVSNLAAPSLKSEVIIGNEVNTSAYSEALWDPKAFNYYPDGGVVALPVSIYQYTYFEGDGIVVEGEVRGDVDVDSSGGGSSGSAGGSAGSADGVDAAPPDDLDSGDSPVDVIAPEPQGFDGIYIYSVSTQDGLTKLGEVSTRFDESQYWGSSFTRAVFVGGDVYAVTDLGVRSAAMTNLPAVQSELFFGLPYDIAEPPFIDPMPLPTEPGDPIDGDLPVSDDVDAGVEVDADAGGTLGASVDQ